MNLHEYRSKQLFCDHGIAVPEGRVASTPEEAGEAARALGGRVAVKAQVLVGGRGKAGGIRLAATPDEASDHARALLGGEIRGEVVHQVLIERAVEIAQELYLGVAVDRALGGLTLIASAEGGVDIETVAHEQPHAIHRIPIDPLIGMRSFQVTTVAHRMGLRRDVWRDLQRVALRLYDLVGQIDATLVEINPLVVTADGALLALDAKVVLDDNALYRHPDLAAWRDVASEPQAERRAREADISYVKLDGHVGCMVNGAGLAMATMDVIALYGEQPANFLDIGGGARADRVQEALEIILADERVQAVLINIFGGITRCDEVARGLVEALEGAGRDVPMVVRLVGTNEAEGQAILEEAGIATADTLGEGARRAVEAARAGSHGSAGR